MLRDWSAVTCFGSRELEEEEEEGVVGLGVGEGEGEGVVGLGVGEEEGVVGLWVGEEVGAGVGGTGSFGVVAEKVVVVVVERRRSVKSNAGGPMRERGRGDRERESLWSAMGLQECFCVKVFESV